MVNQLAVESVCQDWIWGRMGGLALCLTQTIWLKVEGAIVLAHPTNCGNAHAR